MASAPRVMTHEMHLKRLAGMLGALGNGVETDMSSDDEARIVIIATRVVVVIQLTPLWNWYEFLSTCVAKSRRGEIWTASALSQLTKNVKLRLFDLTMDGILKDYSQLCGTEERYTSNVDRIRASIQAIRAAAEDVL